MIEKEFSIQLQFSVPIEKDPDVFRANWRSACIKAWYRELFNSGGMYIGKDEDIEIGLVTFSAETEGIPQIVPVEMLQVKGIGHFLKEVTSDAGGNA